MRFQLTTNQRLEPKGANSNQLVWLVQWLTIVWAVFQIVLRQSWRAHVKSSRGQDRDAARDEKNPLMLRDRDEPSPVLAGKPGRHQGSRHQGSRHQVNRSKAA